MCELPSSDFIRLLVFASQAGDGDNTDVDESAHADAFVCGVDTAEYMAAGTIADAPEIATTTTPARKNARGRPRKQRTPVDTDRGSDPFRCAECGCECIIGAANNLVCTACGALTEGADQISDLHEHASNSVVCMKVGSGASARVRTYNMAMDNADARALAIARDLQACARRMLSDENKEVVPQSVLYAVARRYASLQVALQECGEGRFIHRGNVRKQILASLILDELMVQGLSRKREIIASLLDLPKNGFSSGDSILRDLEGKGLLVLTKNNSATGFAERYLESLSLNTPLHVAFIAGIIAVSMQYNLGLTSQLSSKVAGSIWLLNLSAGYGLTIEQVEVASDNTRGNTIKQYCAMLLANLPKFVDVYFELGVRMPPAGMTASGIVGGPARGRARVPK